MLYFVGESLCFNLPFGQSSSKVLVFEKFNGFAVREQSKFSANEVMVKIAHAKGSSRAFFLVRGPILFLVLEGLAGIANDLSLFVFIDLEEDSSLA